MQNKDSKIPNRRHFLKIAAAGVAAGGLVAARADSAPAAPLRLGLIGSGQRGAWIGDLFQ